MKSLNVKHFNATLMFCSLICFLYSLIVLEWDYIEEKNHYGMPVLALGYVLAIISCISSYKKNQPIIFIVSFLYAIQICFSILISPQEDNIIIDIIKNTTWIVAFFMSYLWSRNNFDFSKAVNIIIFFTLPILSIMFIRLLSQTFFLGDLTTFRDAIFPIAILSPFILFYKNIKIRILLFITVLILIIVSAKRSVILGVILGGIVYFSKIYTDSFHKTRLLISLITLIIFAIAILSYIDIDYTLFDFAFSRFDNIADGDSNGRDTILDKLIVSFNNSDLLNQLFGHGSHSTKNVVGKLAHNDILQVLYDYGCFPLISFFIIYILLIIQGCRMYFSNKYNKEISAIYCYSLILFLFLGMLNCYISSPRTFTFSMFIFGYVLGLPNLKIHYHKKK